MNTTPHIGNMLMDYVKRKRIYQSGWARQQGVTKQTIAKYLKNSSMRIDTMLRICETLNHNFLREIADMLPPSMEPPAVANQQQDITILQQEVEALKLQVATLEKALTLVAGK
jgi:DNA-binding Xre family transcriptional regulator